MSERPTGGQEIQKAIEQQTVPDKDYVKLPSVEEIVDMISDAQHYCSFTRKPRSTFVAEWVRDSIKLGCYTKG